MAAHSNEHLLNVVYNVPEYIIVSPFAIPLYEDVVEISEDDDFLFY